jgi:pimeloyl-ACP methyl ester carboxylesterase
MATVVLVHGAWHGAWCWDRTVAELESRGHRAIAFDLPGHGLDPTPVSAVTLAAYAARTAEVIRAEADPVILVGHSMGGCVITQAAELVPDRIRRLVYLCAYAVADGESLMTWASTDPDATAGEAVRFSVDGTVISLDLEVAPAHFYGDCAEDDIAWAVKHLVPQPMEPFATGVTITDERAGSVERAYIECVNDKACSITLQRRMITARGITAVQSLATSHSPFISAPAALCDAIEALSA